MPFAQLRSLVISLIDAPPPRFEALPMGSVDMALSSLDLGDDFEGDAGIDDAEAAEREFESQPTTYTLNRPRVSTLDALIATLPPRR